MAAQILEKKIEILNNQLRILILQNAREISGYDKAFLYEVCTLSGRILNLQNQLEINVDQKFEHIDRRLVSVS